MKKTKNAAITSKINEAPLFAIAQPDCVIYFVANKVQWEYCESRLRVAKVVGIDTETRPVFCAKRKANPCSLIQLAVRCPEQREEVFVLDLLTLPAKMYNAALARLFLSKQVIKLGQGLFSDLKELAVSYPAASCFAVAKAVVEVNDLSISLLGAHHTISLQKLVYLYLNKRLTKTQQTSNWNRRPLSNSQLHYAASDALVLIHLYDELLQRLQKHTNGKFRIGSVTNVLDVHVEPVPKCTLCFATFETKALLKTHRHECIKGVRSIDVCGVCDSVLVLTSADMQLHTTQCGKHPDDVVTQDAETLRSTAHASSSANKIKQRKPRSPPKRKRARSDASVTSLPAPQTPPSSAMSGAPFSTAVSGAKPAKRRRPKKSKTAPKSAPSSASASPTRRPRKMSEGSLLASDAIWSDISMDLHSVHADDTT